jgi:hypothetical protein
VSAAFHPAWLVEEYRRLGEEHGLDLGRCRSALPTPAFHGD